MKTLAIHITNFGIAIFSPLNKKLLAGRMQRRHSRWVAELQGKKEIRIVFLAIHESVWKVDPVFKKMLKDSFFEPIILVCPYIHYGKERMLDDMDSTYDYFSRKGYPVKKSRNDDGTWVKLEELKPDIVFFTNPHKLTHEEYYENAYRHYLSCYAGYGIAISKYGNYQSQYNQKFHNAMWKIFLQHETGMAISKKFAANKGGNTCLVGDTTIEEILGPKIQKNAWKEQSQKKIKIIWAPHHTITEHDNKVLPYSTFLKYFDVMVALAIDFKCTVQFAFKPHPILKSKLYEHPEWGKEKADSYYDFWQNNPNTQLDEGEYIGLFQQSDAMIHDSASFTAEYLFLNKPVMHLSNKSVTSFFNDFAIEAYACHYKANTPADIRHFIKSDISIDPMASERGKFIDKFSYVTGGKKTPSGLILEIIKNEIGLRDEK